MGRPLTEVSLKKEEKKVSYKEMMDLKEDLKSFKQKEMNGVIMSPFDQWLIMSKIRRQTDNGDLVVCSDKGSEDYHYCKINAALELWEYYREEDARNQFPELREKWTNMWVKQHSV